MPFKQNPLRVLMLLDTLHVGGTETHVLSLVKKLQEKGIYVIVGTGGGPLSGLYKQNGVLLCPLSFNNNGTEPIDFAKLVKEVRDLVAQEQINIIHSHFFQALRVGAVIKREMNIPLVATIHGLYYPLEVLRNTAVFTDKLIAVSYPVEEFLKGQLGFPASKKIRLIPNGVDTAHFVPVFPEIAKKELAINPGYRVILYSSRLDWAKTAVARAVVYACLYLSRRHPDLRCLVIGGGKDAYKLAKLVAKVNRLQRDKLITFLEPQLDLRPFYQAADYVVGTGRVALEAMSCACPVIAAGNAGFFGMITPANINQGWRDYFGDHRAEQPVTVGNITRSLFALANSGDEVARSLGFYGRQWVHKNFEIEDVAKQTILLYYEVKEGNKVGQRLLRQFG